MKSGATFLSWAGVSLLATGLTLACQHPVRPAQGQETTAASSSAEPQLPDAAHLEAESALSAQPSYPQLAPGQLEEAQRPFFGFRKQDGKVLAGESFLTHLASADLLCFGERKGELLDHAAELRLLLGLLERRGHRGFELGLSLEKLGSKQETVMSRFAEKRLQEDKLESQLGVDFGVSFDFYREQLVQIQRRQVVFWSLAPDSQQLALLSSLGLAGLDKNQREDLPELWLYSKPHRRIFDQFGPGRDQKLELEVREKLYEAQVFGDESMAERAVRYLNDRRPLRKLLLLADRSHCARSAIPERVQRRSPLVVLNLLASSGQPEADELAESYDFQWVWSSGEAPSRAPVKREETQSGAPQ